MEMLPNGVVKKCILVKFFTDLEPTFESLTPPRQMEKRGLRMTVKELKEKCLEGEILI